MNTRLPQLLPSASRPLIALVLMFSLFAAAACDGGCGSGSKSATKTSGPALEQLAGHMPASAQLSVFVADLEKTRHSLETARNTLGDALPLSDLIEQQLKSELGVDVFDAESWEKAGIDPKGALSVNVVGKRPVLFTYVSDIQKFEQSFTSQLKSNLGLEGAAKKVNEDGTSLKVLGEGDETVAWTYDGKLVGIVFPQADQIKEPLESDEPDDAVKLAARLMNIDTKDSLAKHAGFERFKKALGDDSVAIYINRDTLFNESGLLDLDSSDPNQKAVAEWVKSNVQAVGVGFGMEDNSLKMRLWSDLPEPVIESAKEIINAPGGFEMESFATENTLIGLRAAVDMPKWWNFYKNELLGEKERAQLNSRLQQIGAVAQLNIEDDLITKLTGNLGVLVYGMDVERAEAQGNPVLAVTSNFAETLAVIVPLQFKDKESLNKVVNSLIKANDGLLERSSLNDNVDVVRVANTTMKYGSLYIKDDLLVYATETFSDDSVLEYINGEREEGALGDNKALDLGKEFASGKDYNGLYLNFVRAQNHLGDLVQSQMPPATQFLNKLEEADLNAEIGEYGGYLNLNIDFTPQPKAEEE